jgi:intergrase/recombinase
VNNQRIGEHIMSQQLAQCIQIIKYEKKEAYVMKMEGREFTLFQSKYFRATKGKFYTPLVYVSPEKKIRISWHEANNQSVPL